MSIQRWLDKKNSNPQGLGGEKKRAPFLSRALVKSDNMLDKLFCSAVKRFPWSSDVFHKVAANRHRRFRIRMRVVRWVISNLGKIRHEAESLRVQEPIERSAYAFWAQGFSAAPEIVSVCGDQLERVCGERIKKIDWNSLGSFVSLPRYITENKEISLNHFSDVLRVALLFERGGVWVDATCLCMLDPVLETNEYDFFAYSGARGVRISSWFLSARQGCYIARMMYAAQRVYWSQPKRPYLGYFMFHDIFEALCFVDENFSKHWKQAPKVGRGAALLLQKSLLRTVSEEEFFSLLGVSGVHKLTYKYHSRDASGGTVLDRIKSSFPPSTH